MKKFLVIGNPIEHSLSPKLHNYWIKESNIAAIYDKKKLNESDIKGIIAEVKNGKIDGINVTVPFKNSVIPFLDELTPIADEVKSVNTIFKKNNKVIGDNTDIEGFKNGLKHINYDVRNKKIDGVNVTVPFKKSVIPFLDQLSPEANEAQSVNTIYKQSDKVIGHNTDAGGFELALKYINYDVKNKKIFVLGAGGVVPSIILALKKMKASKIILSNRTRKKAEDLKKIFSDLEIIDWGETPDFNIIINATSLGLKKDDEIKLDYADIGSNKLFYDIIYKPSKTNFLKNAKQFGNQIENGKMMFIYQAHQAFNVWHKIMPEINDETIKLLD